MAKWDMSIFTNSLPVSALSHVNSCFLGLDLLSSMMTKLSPFSPVSVLSRREMPTASLAHGGDRVDAGVPTWTGCVVGSRAAVEADLDLT